MNKWALEQHFDEDKEAPGKSYSKWMGALDEEDRFDAAFFNISPREAERMDPQQRLFLEESWKALEDAAYNPQRLAGAKCGVFVGVSQGDYSSHFEQEEADSHLFTGTSASILAGRIAYYLDLQGPAVSVDTACSSSLVAIHQACQSIQAGESTMAIAGGVYVMTTQQMHVLTSKAGMLSESGKCYTFDQRADGMVPGEAVGVVILKPLLDAERDGDQIFGVIRGSGINQDGKTNGITAPNYASQARLEKEVYDNAGIHPETITYVENHGTGTKLGDPIEIQALKEAFGSPGGKNGFCGLGSVKSNIGHTLTAAGVSSLIKVLLALRHKQLPPTIHFQKLNEHIELEGSPFYINTQLKDWAPSGNLPRRAAVSSFGFSGTNAHLVVEEYLPPERPAYTGTEPAIVLLSAKNRERLIEQVRNLKQYLEQHPQAGLFDIAYTLQIGRAPMTERLAIVVENKNLLARQLDLYLAGKTDDLLSGNTEENKADFTLEGEAGKAYLAAAVKNREISSLARLWIKGVNIDWHLLYPGPRPKKRSLPTYPFARERYWVPAKEEATAAPSKEQTLHPLVQHNVSNLKEQKFSSSFDGQEHFLTHHLVNAQMTLPATAYVEMARAAGQCSLEENITQLQNITWLAPIRVTDQPLEVNIRLFDQDSTIAFEVYSWQDEEISHCQGILGSAAQPPPSAFDLDAIRRRLTHTTSRKACYDLFRTMGLDYGPSFQGIETLYYSRDEAFSKINLEGKDEYVLSPGLLDSTLQTCIGLVLGQDNEPGTILPFSAQTISIYRDLKGAAWAYARKANGQHQGREGTGYDVDLLNDSGQVLLSIEGLTALPFQPPGQDP